MAISILVRGDTALFPRPEFVRDLVSYDMMTPRAARGILDAIHWRPSIRWRVDRIHVLHPVAFAEPVPIGDEASALPLSDVAYVIEAHFEMTAAAAPEERAGQHAAMFRRRMTSERYFRAPYLGVPGCAATVSLIEGDLDLPRTMLPSAVDFGWVMHDVGSDGLLRYFHAKADRGVITVPAYDDPGLFR